MAAGEDKHYVVFNCQACGARIFAEAKQIGRAGMCPSCKQMTGVLPKDPKARVAGPSSTTRGGVSPSISTDSSRIAAQTAPRPSKAGDRRRARRIPVTEARVGVEGKARDGRPPTPASELWELVDISEGGIGYLAPGEPSKKSLTGVAPPIKPGETISVTLHVPSLFRPRTVKAIVRRVEPHGYRKELFKVGCEFVSIADDARDDIRKLVEKRV